MALCRSAAVCWAFCGRGLSATGPSLRRMALTADSTLLTASASGPDMSSSSLPGRCGPWARQAM